MLSVAAEDFSLTTWKGDAFRLIPSRFPPVSVYDGLVADGRVEALVAVEDITNPRLRSIDRLARLRPGVPADAPRLQNWNHAPFAYGNPEGSRFFDHLRPCLELAADRQTALAVSVARRERFLARTREAPIGLDMRMLRTPAEGRFVDLRHVPADLDAKACREIGSRVSSEADGVLYHPPERSSATCLAVLRASVLGRSIQTVHYRYVWTGRRIALLYAFDDEGREVRPETLGGEEDVLAA